MPRRAVAALGALLLAVTAAVLPVPGSGAAAGPPATGAGPTVELISQTPVAQSGEPFVMTLGLTGVPGGGALALTVHQRVRSRSELALSMEGEELRSVQFTLVVPLSDLPAQADGTRRLVLPINSPGGLPLPTEGVYPVQITAQDAAGAALASLVTHLIVPPDPGDEAPNLAVALVAEAAAPVALQPDGTIRLSRADIDGLTAMVAGLNAAPDVPATLSVQPETIDALLGSAEPGAPEVVPELAKAARGRMVLENPYVPLDVDALAPAGLLSEYGPQLERGSAGLRGSLGVEPDDDVQLAAPTLGQDGLAVLAYTQVTRVVVDDEHLAPLPDGIISYSLAQPFVVALPDDAEGDDRTPGQILGLAPDPVVMERLHTDGTPGLAVSRTLAELALLRLEQPSVARSSVLRLTSDLPGDTVEQLVEAIGTGRPFQAVTLTGAFDHAATLLDGGGNPVDRALVPDDPDEISSGVARAINAGRVDVDTFAGVVGRQSPLPDLPDRHLLVATAAGFDDRERRDHVDAAQAAMGAVTSQVTTPPTFTLTLTAREGTIPLTIRNDSGVPVRVSINLHSQKLEFPDGDTIEQTLTEDVTRIDIRVRSRATGAFPLLIDVRTPDGEQSLSVSRYTVRSTAVSGAGLLLSVGAGVFLTVWWARHWRRTRRNRRLIATNGHPSSTDPVAQ